MELKRAWALIREAMGESRHWEHSPDDAVSEDECDVCNAIVAFDEAFPLDTQS